MSDIEIKKEKLVRRMGIRIVYDDARSRLDKAFNDRDGQRIIEINNSFNIFLLTILENKPVDQEMLELMNCLSLMLHDKAIEYLKSI